MEVFHVFVLVILVLRKNVVSESEVVSAGDTEYQCGSDGQIIKTKSNTTKLRLPPNCQAFYSVNTERSTNCTNQQRCILMTWKIIRDFEMYLNKNHNNTGVYGVVEFKNEMIIPDFNYMLHVTLKHSDGQIKDKDFKITFSDINSTDKSKKVIGELELNIGSPYLGSVLPVIVNANVTLCGNVSYYIFTWSVMRNKEEVVLPEKSSKLTILPQNLNINNQESCTIICRVIDIENNSTIVEESTSIYYKDAPEGLQNKIDVSLPFKSTTISAGIPITITPYIHSPLMAETEYKIQWSCMLENRWLSDCQGQINREFYMANGFTQDGNYSIVLKVIGDTLEKTALCSIQIIPDVPSIEFNTELPIRPGRGIEITAKVHELRTYCTVQWGSEKEPYVELNDIPGFDNIIYNISSRDKTFLEDIEEYGNITVTKEFKFKVPPPSRTWNGLVANSYELELIVSCPALAEINDMTVIEEQPEHFVTTRAKTELTVPNLPCAKSLKVFSDGDEALKSVYFYDVARAVDTTSSMMYKYGLILENLEVVFYCGIDVFSAKTVMPYNGGNGIETFIEVCDYEDQCGKTFGPLIITSSPNDLDAKRILKMFKQKLIEEDYYQAFSYAFIVLHSVNFLDLEDKYSALFSSEISHKINFILEEEPEIREPAINKFLKNLVIFIHHLALSEEVMGQLSLMTEEFSIDTNSHLRVVRDASRSLTAEANAAELQEIRNYLSTSEYLILNSLNSEAIEKEKEHMLNLLDGWMTQACEVLFNGQRVARIEMKTMLFTIEKISEGLLDRFITIPFSNNIWNVTAKLQIKDMSDYSSKTLCLGQTMLNQFFNRNSVVFGANIYMGENQPTEAAVSAKISICMPIDREISKTMQPECLVYKKGWNRCSVTKQFTNFVECLCPSFGYFFIEYTNITYDVEDHNIIEFRNTSFAIFNSTNDNKSDDIFYNNVQLGRKISYVIIFSSLVGFLILCYIIRKLTAPLPPQNLGLDGFHDNEQYAHVMQEELLD